MNAAAIAFEAGDYETSVSRAYYAAYHAIIAAFEAKMEETPRRWSHHLTRYFSRVPELDGTRLTLHALYEQRIVADYESASFSRADADELLNQASGVISTATEVIRDA